MTSSQERDAFLNFIRLNTALWSTEAAAAPESTSNRVVLVDLLSHDLQIYAMRALYIAKILQKRYGYRLVGIIGNLIFSRELEFDYQKTDAVKLARSFGVVDFIDLEEAAAEGWSHGVGQFITADTKATANSIRNCSDQDLTDLILGLRTADGCRIGEYIYETVIRVTRDPFVTNVRAKLEDVLREAYYMHNVIRGTCKNNHVEAFVTGHYSYTQWGMSADLVLRSGGKMIWFDCEGNFSAYLLTRPPVGQETLAGLVRQIETALFEREFQERYNLDSQAIAKIQFLFSNNCFARPFWFEPAKKPPAALTPVLRKMALQTLGWPEDARPVICIFFHCFSDLPRDDEQVYLDYYVWVAETLKIAVQDTTKNWIFKTHPWNRGLYDVTNVTDRLKEEYQGHKHIFFLEDELQKMEVFAVCDLAVTVRGSIAYEMSVFGKPALAAGRSVWSNLGFCHIARNIEEYKDFLTTRFDTLKLSSDMQERANFYLFYDKVICRVESTFIPFWTYQLTGNSSVWNAMSDRILYNISDLDPAAGAIRAMYEGGAPRIINPTFRQLMATRVPAKPDKTRGATSPPSVAATIPTGGSLSFGFEGNGAPALLSRPVKTDEHGSWFSADQEALVGVVLRSDGKSTRGVRLGLRVHLSAAPLNSFLNVAANGCAIQRMALGDGGTRAEVIDLGIDSIGQEDAIVVRLWLSEAAGRRLDFRLDSVEIDALNGPGASE